MNSGPSRDGTRKRLRGVLEVALVAGCLTLPMLRPAAAADLSEIEALIRQGRYQQAEKALRSLSDPSGASDYLLGFALIQLYRFDEAEEALRGAVAAAPSDVDRLHALAKSLLEQGKNLAAIEVLDRALAVETRPNLLFARAMCALNAGREQEAERDLEASLAGGGRSAEALYKLGRLALDRGEYRRARERLAASLEVDPGHLEALFSLGLTQLRSGNARESIPTFERVLVGVPGHVGALYNLARAYQVHGRTTEAASTLERFRDMSGVEDEVEFLEKAVRKNPANVDGRIALARKLLVIGRAESALNEAQVARQQAPGRPEIYRVMAEALSRLGRADDARRAEEFARRIEVGS